MTSRLSLITKLRRKILRPDVATLLKQDCESILFHFDCSLIEIDVEEDQAWIKFSYPLTICLPDLIRELKWKTAMTVFQGSQGFDLPSFEDVWSDAYFISSCDVSAQSASEMARPTAGEMR